MPPQHHLLKCYGFSFQSFPSSTCYHIQHLCPSSYIALFLHCNIGVRLYSCMRSCSNNPLDTDDDSIRLHNNWTSLWSVQSSPETDSPWNGGSILHCECTSHFSSILLLSKLLLVLDSWVSKIGINSKPSSLVNASFQSKLTASLI